MVSWSFTTRYSSAWARRPTNSTSNEPSPQNASVDGPGVIDRPFERRVS